MPNTSSAKKALRGSLKKKAFNLVKKSNIKNALRDFRRVLSTNPSEYKATLSRAFSALDKAVKTNFIPKARADRKKSRLAAMVAKATGYDGTITESTKPKVEKKVVVKKEVVAKPKVVAKKTTVKKEVVAKPKAAVKKITKKAE